MSSQPEKAQAQGASATPHGGTILIVDDEPEIVDLVIELLKQEGYSVRAAYNGREALKMIEEQPRRLLLLDLLMPEFNGYDVLHALQQRQPQTMAIVVFTANRFDEAELQQSGADEILPKPFLLDDLLQCVTRHLPY